MEIKTAGILGVFAAASIVGYILGRSTSPDPADPSTAASYLAMYSNWTWGPEYGHGTLSLRIDPVTYRYRTGSNTLAVEYLSPAEMAAKPMPKRNFEDDFDKFVELGVADAGGGLAVTAVADEHLLTMAWREKSLVLVGAVLTGGLGYWLGHRRNPELKSEKFRASLEKVDLWKSYESFYEGQYSTARVVVSKALLDASSKHKDYLSVRATIHDSCCGQEKAEENRLIRRHLLQHNEIIAQLAIDPFLTYVASDAHVRLQP